MSALVLSDLVSLRAGRDASAPVSLTAPIGALTVLVGPNGCGKSTLLSSLTGALPYRGSARLDGVELASLTPRERAKRIALAPQLPARPHLPLRDALRLARTPYLSLSARLSESDLEAIDAAVEKAGATPYLDRTLDTLSGGELCRASLALTLAQGASFLCLDEITAHLDPSASGELLTLVQRLTRESRYGVLLVLHDLSAALAVADRIAVMRSDGTVAEGTPTELLATKVLDETFGVRRHETSDGRIFFDALQFS